MSCPVTVQSIYHFENVALPTTDTSTPLSVILDLSAHGRWSVSVVASVSVNSPTGATDYVNSLITVANVDSPVSTEQSIPQTVQLEQVLFSDTRTLITPTAVFEVDTAPFAIAGNQGLFGVALYLHTGVTGKNATGTLVATATPIHSEVSCAPITVRRAIGTAKEVPIGEAAITYNTTHKIVSVDLDLNAAARWDVLVTAPVTTVNVGATETDATFEVRMDDVSTGTSVTGYVSDPDYLTLTPGAVFAAERGHHSFDLYASTSANSATVIAGDIVVQATPSALSVSGTAAIADFTLSTSDEVMATLTLDLGCAPLWNVTLLAPLTVTQTDTALVSFYFEAIDLPAERTALWSPPNAYLESTVLSTSALTPAGAFTLPRGAYIINVYGSVNVVGEETYTANGALNVVAVPAF